MTTATSENVQTAKISSKKGTTAVPNPITAGEAFAMLRAGKTAGKAVNSLLLEVLSPLKTAKPSDKLRIRAKQALDIVTRLLKAEFTAAVWADIANGTKSASRFQTNLAVAADNSGYAEIRAVAEKAIEILQLLGCASHGDHRLPGGMKGEEFVRLVIGANPTGAAASDLWYAQIVGKTTSPAKADGMTAEDFKKAANASEGEEEFKAE